MVIEVAACGLFACSIDIGDLPAASHGFGVDTLAMDSIVSGFSAAEI